MNFTRQPVRLILLSTLLCLASCANKNLAERVDTRPNILFIMTDDHAAHAMSCYGSAVNQTPHMDRIAREGMLFKNVFATNSICTPSRATILTGKYSHMNGAPVFNRFDGSQPTVAKYLQAAGYHTGLVGKWHLGSDPTGFDHWIVLPGQGLYHNPLFLSPSGQTKITGYVSDIITDLSLDFLDQRPKDKPFMLMLHHKAPHRGWNPDEKHRKMFANRTIPEPSTLWDDYATRTDAIKESHQKVFTDMNRGDLKLIPPPELKGPERQKWLNTIPQEVELEIDGRKTLLKGKDLDRWKYQQYMRDYLACVQSVDDNIGRVLDYLDKNSLAQNTIIIYTSDQGFFLGDHGLYDKRFMYEESLRMPFVVRWPAAIKPGSVEDAIATNCDFAPTFMDVAGLSIPSDIQGRSMLPLLKGGKPDDWPTSMYYRYYHDPGHHDTRQHYGIRTQTHKLIYFWTKNQWELYDLGADPRELNNIYNDPAQAPLVSKLTAELYRLKLHYADADQFSREQPPPGVDEPHVLPQTPSASRPAGRNATRPSARRRRA